MGAAPGHGWGWSWTVARGCVLLPSLVLLPRHRLRISVNASPSVYESNSLGTHYQDGIARYGPISRSKCRGGHTGGQ
eukprot:4118939-Pyramimonas_sp.AAC.1